MNNISPNKDLSTPLFLTACLLPLFFFCPPKSLVTLHDCCPVESVGLSWVKSSEQSSSVGNKQPHVLGSLLQLWADHRCCLIPEKSPVCLQVHRATQNFGPASKACSITLPGLLTESKRTAGFPTTTCHLLCAVLSPSCLDKHFVLSFRCHS